MDLPVLLEVASELAPTRVIATDADRSLTLAELRDEALALAAVLASRDVPSGPVGLVTTNSVLVPVTLFAAALAGRALVPLNYRADPELMAHLLRTVPVGAVIGEPRYRDLITAGAPPGTPFISGADAPPAAPRAALPEPDPEATAMFLFTSGSTAMPKAVSLRHRNLTSYVIDSVAPLSEPPSAASLVAAPCYHIAALANVLTSTYAGRRMVFLRSFSPAEWLRVANTQRVTHAFVVPTMLFRVIAEVERGSPFPATLTSLAYGGSRMPPGLVERALAALPSSVGLVNAYGLTETSSTIALLGPEDHRVAAASTDPSIRRRLSSVGRPLPGVQVKVGADGEILVRGDQVSGDRAGLDGGSDDGWLRTGDLGEIDADGYIFVTGRRDDMIIRGGENISPTEVEDVLRAYPGIRDAVVVGVPDAEWGERVEAAVEAEGRVEEAALAHWAHQRLPGFKCPVRIMSFDSLPRNELGKVLRPAVRERLSAAPVDP